ncbi:MAG: hypothetical protein LBL45_09115 [Treponema sp.]|jgi:hypothetical protein|nr:hypothetical protein [Treponema sp.]
MKRNRILFVFFIAVFLSACSADSFGEGSGVEGLEVKTGKATFFNEPSYTATVHVDAFSGPVLIESLGVGQSRGVNVRTSDNYGIGSAFCVEYSYKVVDGTDLASGEVWAKGVDPNIQINFVVEENRYYTIQILQPAELEFPAAFKKFVTLQTCSLNCTGMERRINRRETGIFRFPREKPACTRFLPQRQASFMITTRCIPP